MNTLYFSKDCKPNATDTFSAKSNFHKFYRVSETRMASGHSGFFVARHCLACAINTHSIPADLLVSAISLRQIPSNHWRMPMALTDIQARSAKPKSKPYKLSDGNGMHWLVSETGKYWRMNYRFRGKQKTLALGIYPETTLADARQKRIEARKLLAGD
jgi:hypothetical protein